MGSSAGGSPDVRSDVHAVVPKSPRQWKTMYEHQRPPRPVHHVIQLHAVGLGLHGKLAADKFLNAETLGILFLGLIAFAIGTASGVLLAKLMNVLSREPINPLIGAAGVSAVPMAARVVNKVGLENNPHNFLLMHAMGPNVAGVLGSAVAAGVLLALTR